jgi:plasmid stabilization system protein ParE
MEYNLIITSKAEQDFNDILDYLVNELYSPKAATDFADAVQKCYELIKLNPELFMLSDLDELAESGYRRALIKNYILLYKVNNKDQIITIHRFFHGMQNYVVLI